jgi:type VI secretion system protein ImpJ
MLLAPQHLQQFDRYLQHLIAQRFRVAHGFDWGFASLDLDPLAIRNGRLELRAATGVFPDGTPFSMPDDDALPAARAIEGHLDSRQEALVAYLGIPSARPGRPEVGAAGPAGSAIPRFSPTDEPIPDSTNGLEERVITTARRNLAFVFPDDALGEYDILPLAQITRTPDGGYALREEFIPPLLFVGASERLVRLLSDWYQRLVAKSTALGDMRRQRGSEADFATQDTGNFLKLHAIDTSIPRLAHMVGHRRAHPEEAYLELVTLAGMLCAHSSEVHPKDLPAYDHGGLERTFQELDATLRKLYQDEPAARAVRIDLTRQGALHVAHFQDPRLVESASRLFLGVRADVEKQVLVGELPAKLKIASHDRIDYIIANALRGLPLQFVPVPPGGLPVKTGFCYFELEQRGDLWKAIHDAKDLALFVVPPEYPAMALELWGLRD